jgi:hypothetical protein
MITHAQTHTPAGAGVLHFGRLQALQHTHRLHDQAHRQGRGLHTLNLTNIVLGQCVEGLHRKQIQ